MAQEGNIPSPDEQRRFDDLEFGIMRSIRYHNHRRLFFDRLDKFIKIFSLVTGSGAFATAVASHQGLTVMFAAFVAIRLAIESDEPPALRVLDTICHNELCRALGCKSSDFYKVDPVQSLFANIIDLWPWRMKREASLADH